MIETRRRTLTGVAFATGVLAVIAVGYAIVRGITSGTDAAPTASPSPPEAVTVATTAAPSGAESPTPSGTTPNEPGMFRFSREPSIDDATVLARMANPRTGETWHDPVRRPQYDALLPQSWDSPVRAFVVGQRDGFDIVIGLSDVSPEWLKWSTGPIGLESVGLYEIRDGLAYFVPCPSARSLDPCDPASSNNDVAATPVDWNVFYDSLTYPASASLDGGLVGRLTDGDSDPGGYPGAYPLQAFDLLAAFEPDAFSPLGTPTTTTLATLPGGSAVVRVDLPSNITGVTNAIYGYRTPFGGEFYLDPHESNQEYAPPFVSGLDWNASASPPTTLPLADDGFYAIPAAGYQCDSGIVFSIDHTHTSSEWRKVATDDRGRSIYAPVAGGNRVALAVYTRMQDLVGWDTGKDLYGALAPGTVGESRVHGEPTDPYPFATYDAFVDQYGVLTFEIAPGVWALAARAMADIYECA